jgi:hypothetical protein
MDKFWFFSIFLLIFCCSFFVKATGGKEDSDKYIVINGSIDSSLTYKVKVTYVAVEKTKDCQKYHVKLGDYVALTETYEYFPEIAKTSHTVNVPLDSKEANDCGWMPAGISLCVNARGAAPSQCGSLFHFNGQHLFENKIEVECSDTFCCFKSNGYSRSGAINQFNRSYRVDISSK